MTTRTIIDSLNFVIADPRDDTVKGIVFDGNKNVKYLPYKIHTQFPNLIIYKSNRCAVKQIAMDNFENLSKLKEIELSFNHVQKISANIFKQLPSLKKVYLSELLLFSCPIVSEIKISQMIIS